MKSIQLNNYGIIQDTLPDKLFMALLSEVDKLDMNNPRIDNLSGPNIPNHYVIQNQEVVTKLNKYLETVVMAYEHTFNILPFYQVFSEPCPLCFDAPWIQIQNKGQVVPQHDHPGVFAWTIWMKIPYDLEEELGDGNRDGASTFHFMYSDILGGIKHHTVPISKEYEGQILFFPAKLRHAVNPFYTTDESRVIIAGNVLFNSDKDR